MASKIHQLHFLIVPLMSQGHLIPFMDMAKLLAHRGQTVSIVMTPLNAARFNAIIDYAIHSNLKIQFITLPFPCQEAGLPEGCENLDSLPSRHLGGQFFEACNMLQKPLEKRLEELETRPTCIISDYCLAWTSDTALRFKIPRVVFHTIPCFTQVLCDNLSRYKVRESVTSDSEPFLVPGMPDRIEFTMAQLPEWAKRNSGGMRDRLDKFQVAEESSQGMVLNTCEEIEPRYVEEYRNRVGKKNVWCMGPLSLSNKTISSKFERGDKASIDEQQCLKWLDSKKPSSVIYVCFGTLSNLLTKQLIELGLGLEASNCPFIWIIKKGNHSTETEKWLVEEKFEERLNGRGLIIRGWAPQTLILSHPAIGGFLTHCGWNSTLEGVSSGVPMITWPMSSDQFLNEKLIVHVLKIGVRIGVEAIMEPGHEEKVGVWVKREDVANAIQKLVDEDEEGEERSKRAKELAEMTKRAVEEGGSSYLNVTKFIQHIMQLVSHDGPTK